MESLESALSEAQKQTTRLDLQPLASQLRSAATRLRQSANGSAALVQPIATRLESVAGDLLQVGQGQWLLLLVMFPALGPGVEVWLKAASGGC